MNNNPNYTPTPYTPDIDDLFCDLDVLKQTLKDHFKEYLFQIQQVEAARDALAEFADTNEEFLGPETYKEVYDLIKEINNW